MPLVFMRKTLIVLCVRASESLVAEIDENER